MEIKEIRQRNAAYLGEKHGRQGLADKLGYQDTKYVNLLIQGNSLIGDRTARKFEEKLNLERGWMDVPHPHLWGIDDMERLSLVRELLSSLSTSDLSDLIDDALREIRSRDK